MTNRENNSARPSTIASARALVEHRCEEAEKKQRLEAQFLQEQGYTPDDIAALDAEAKMIREEIRNDKQPHRGMASNSIVELVQGELFAGEAAGHYSKKAIAPESGIPLAMTRFGFFMPHERSSQKEMVDADLTLTFETPWGSAIKSGQPLNVDDEDVFLTLGRLKQHELHGDTSLMPISVQDPMGRGNAGNVHTLIATPAMIRDQLGLVKAGENNAKIFEAIKRMAMTRLQFERLSGFNQYTGTIISLFDVAWQRYEQDGVYYIQFSPIISEWFANDVTWIDWEVRMALPNATSKAVHRFLSGQRASYEIGNKKLQTTIMHRGLIGEFNRDLKKGLEVMKDMGWVTYWKIEGTGRKTPQKLIIER